MPAAWRWLRGRADPTRKAGEARGPMRIGAEGDFDGVIDLLTMKAYKFEGEMGSIVSEYEIPENLKADADKYHAEVN